ncbi:MAG TPA: sialidase family protein, partial [Bryobacteraceae bacterium]|nr:sialidase family protein [Bryobacteraceae bacterium]
MRKACLLLILSAAVPAFPQTKAEAVQNPSAPGSLQANWSATPDGSPLMSWVEPSKGGSLSLRYAVFRGGKWSDPQTVAANRHFFRHPAEVPEVIEISDKQWMAHWVEMPNESSEAEFVYVSSSTDGMHWSMPLMAHKDKGQVEHGLASMAVSPNGEISVFWLHTPEGEDGPGYLMRTVVDANGKEIKEERLDDDVCNCCPTAVAKTSKGLVVAYRDHSPDDIRDIAVIRLENGKWSPSKIIHADNWKLNACPTNAAAVAARGDKVAVAWYTGAQNTPKVQVAFSTDGGATFGKPTVVSTGHAFGYTSLALDDQGNAAISWLEQGGAAGARVLGR